MKTSKQLIDGHACNMHIDANHCRPVLVNAYNVFALQLLYIGFGVRPLEPGRPDFLKSKDTTAEQAGAPWLQIVHCSANLIDAALTIGIKPYA
jgi:hypothetical protein